MIKSTQQAEWERMSNKPKPKWELFESFSLVETVHKAIELGWAEKKVQVKAQCNQGEFIYTIEPFEKDCNCPSLLRYEDYAPERTSNEG